MDESYAMRFEDELSRIPMEFRHLIDIEWMHLHKVMPMRFWSHLNLTAVARDYVIEIIHEVISNHDEKAVRLICSNYAGGLCLLSRWPGKTEQRMLMHVDEDLRSERHYRKYPSNRDVITELCTPKVLWVRDTRHQKENWWQFQSITELRAVKGG